MSYYIFFLACLLWPVVASEPLMSPIPFGKDGVRVAFNAKGLSSIQYGGVEFLSNGEFAESWSGTDLRAANGQVGTADRKGGTMMVDAPRRTVTRTYPWGGFSCTYTPRGHCLLIDITIRNTSDKTMITNHLKVLELKLPTKSREYDNTTPMLATNIGKPSVVPLSYKGGAVVLTNEDFHRPLLLGYPWAVNRPTSTVFPLWALTARHPMLPTSLPFIDRPIAPNQSDQYHLSLRFGGAGTLGTDLTDDLYKKYAATYPRTLKWKDRRPIGTFFLASSYLKLPTNPRGWWKDKTVDVTTDTGRAAFRKRVLAYATQSVQILKEMNAQGMITWDIEGEESWQPNTYLGDPRLLKELAPEMDSVADDYFRKFREAGLRVGVCLRPQRLDLVALRKSEPAQKELLKADKTLDVDAVTKLLIDKITYAKKRWGCTLFYVDSNGDPNLPYDVTIFQRVAAAYPDVLLIPEHETTRYYAYTAPLISLQHVGQTAPFAQVLQVYPKAFNVNLASNSAMLDQHREALVQAVRAGSILTFRGWYFDPNNPKIKSIYRAAK